ncbi:hypothetical protein ACLBSM_31235, partial [Klebsiella pneumoniae]
MCCRTGRMIGMMAIVGGIVLVFRTAKVRAG